MSKYVYFFNLDNHSFLISAYIFLDFLKNKSEKLYAYLGKSRSKILFSIGPFFDFLLDHDSEYSLFDEDENIILGADYNSLRDNEFGYGLMASAGISFDFNKNKLQLISSYQYNLDNLIDVVEKTSKLPDISNFNTFTLSLVYLLKVKN